MPRPSGYSGRVGAERGALNQGLYMRAILTALTVAFALGGFAGAAQAHCGHDAEKGDFETPPPVSSATKKPQKEG